MSRHGFEDWRFTGNPAPLARDNIFPRVPLVSLSVCQSVPPHCSMNRWTYDLFQPFLTTGGGFGSGRQEVPILLTCDYLDTSREMRGARNPNPYILFRFPVVSMLLADCHD